MWSSPWHRSLLASCASAEAGWSPGDSPTQLMWNLGFPGVEAPKAPARPSWQQGGAPVRPGRFLVCLLHKNSRQRADRGMPSLRQPTSAYTQYRARAQPGAQGAKEPAMPGVGDTAAPPCPPKSTHRTQTGSNLPLGPTHTAAQGGLPSSARLPADLVWGLSLVPKIVGAAPLPVPCSGLMHWMTASW